MSVLYRFNNLFCSRYIFVLLRWNASIIRLFIAGKNFLFAMYSTKKKLIWSFKLLANLANRLTDGISKVTAIIRLIVNPIKMKEE